MKKAILFLFLSFLILIFNVAQNYSIGGRKQIIKIGKYTLANYDLFVRLYIEGFERIKKIEKKADVNEPICVSEYVYFKEKVDEVNVINAKIIELGRKDDFIFGYNKELIDIIIPYEYYKNNKYGYFILNMKTEELLEGLSRKEYLKILKSKNISEFYENNILNPYLTRILVLLMYITLFLFVFFTFKQIISWLMKLFIYLKK